MADARPFKGIRYDSSRFGRDLTNLVCPPYDVISAEQQKAFYQKHPKNMIRLELATTDVEHDRYQQAAAAFSAWQGEGTMRPDSVPAYYAYLQAFRVEGVERERRGLIAAMRVEAWDTRTVRPHERTLSGPKQDRLALMRACRANFSPIWGLYRDGSGATGRLWDSIEGTQPDMEAVDGDGVRHQVWAVSEHSLVYDVQQMFSREPVYIADGHHRYETALHFRDQVHAEAVGWSEDAAANFAMTYLVDSADPGLVVLGTHRVISSPRPLDPVTFRGTLERWLEVEDHGGSPSEILESVEAELGWPAFGVWAPSLGLALVARARDVSGVPLELSGAHSDAWRRLDLAVLHTLAVDQLFLEGTTALSEAGHVEYSRSLDEVERRILSGEADVAFLARRTPVDHVLAVADAGDLMPEKSTYFFPKPVSGMVIGSLDGEIPSSE
ncbi:MAG: hypothetical protein HW416_1442 [Chloroflexi bacterium]|nr:hypothetical protein [Chloroflexota bacterium]